MEASSKILDKGKKDMGDKMNLIIFIESARSMLALPKICEKAWELAEKHWFVPDALVFGSDDYCADIGT